MAGPFDGIRVIDFTKMIAGPLATMTLADQGADVIKVEPPNGGDHTRLVATARNGFPHRSSTTTATSAQSRWTSRTRMVFLRPTA